MLQDGTPKRVFLQIGMLDWSGATRTDWSELGDTERPGEVGDCRKALEIGSPPSDIPFGAWRK